MAEIDTELASGAWLGRALAAAGRFRPSARVANATLRSLRGAARFPRYVEAEVNGRRIALDLDEEIDRKIFLYGAFDERGLKLIRQIMAALKCRTVLDVGANIGNHTAFFCDLAGRVICFEPNPSIFARLQHFIALNALGNVQAFACGLSNRSGQLDFFVYPGAAGMASLERKPGSTLAGQVAVRRGDDVVAEQCIRDVDFIKIDVEEHEYEVLNGFKATIARDQPVISMEFRGLSIAKFGSEQSMAALLPGYRFFGTGRGGMSRLLKSALRLERFVYGRTYDHLFCVPDRRLGEFAAFQVWEPG